MTEGSFTIAYVHCNTAGCDFGGVYIKELEDPLTPDLPGHLRKTGHEDSFTGCMRPIEFSVMEDLFYE